MFTHTITTENGTEIEFFSTDFDAPFLGMAGFFDGFNVPTFSQFRELNRAKRRAKQKAQKKARQQQRKK